MSDDVFADDSDSIDTDSPFADESDLDLDFEFDSEIANIPDGPVLVKIQQVIFKKEYKPDKGVTTVGCVVQSKIEDDGHGGMYNGQFVSKYIWWGNDKPDPRGVRNWIQFVEAVTGSPVTGHISPQTYNPVRRTVGQAEVWVLSDFDDAYVVAVQSTKQKEGVARQEVVAWKNSSTWEGEDPLYGSGSESPF